MSMADNNMAQPGMQAQVGKFGAGRGNRPKGVTILAVFQILVGIIYVALGLVSGALIGILGAAFGVIVLIVGIFAIVTGLALFTGKNWARILIMIGGVLDLIDIPIGTIIGIVILWYFTRPNVKAYFGK
ncbi:hypothetical protein M1373_01650 [Candidatus Marsarchaeota archaeon]|nr:hypothetical protein [Candidatus Marsarchaeota archaeon]MCL5404624.1 hypothetical protein [Candidatus Marsarchaeota archaeon]